MAALLALEAGCVVNDVVKAPEGGGADTAVDSSDADAADDAVDDAVADSDGSGGADGSGDAAGTDPCDLTGLWAVKGSFYARDSLFSSSQLSNNWFFLELEDDGENVRIVDGWDCGIRVEGAASVTITEETTEALRQRNSQVGRSGVAVLDGDTCRIEFERWFWVRGGQTSLLPDDFSAYHDDDALARLQDERPLPTRDDLTNAEDTENDGQPGMAYQVGGAATGARHVVQRDWNQYATTADRVVRPADLADSFVVGADFDVREELLATTGCGALGCGLIEAGSSADPAAPHCARFVRVDPSFAEESPIDTCFKVQELIPWERPDNAISPTLAGACQWERP